MAARGDEDEGYEAPERLMDKDDVLQSKNYQHSAPVFNDAEDNLQSARSWVSQNLQSTTTRRCLSRLGMVQGMSILSKKVC